MTRVCVTCGSPHSRKSSKYCSKPCMYNGYQERTYRLAEKQFDEAVRMKPPTALRVEKREEQSQSKAVHGGIRITCVYIFLCSECNKKEITRTCHRVNHPEKYGDTLSLKCRACANKHLWDMHKRPYEHLFNYMKKSVSKRAPNFDLTFEEFVEFTKIGNCDYCGSRVRWHERSVPGRCYGYNLDRKNNDEGYSKENCTVCCGECNRVKGGVYTYSQMKVLGSVLAQLSPKSDCKTWGGLGRHVPNENPVAPTVLSKGERFVNSVLEVTAA